MEAILQAVGGIESATRGKTRDDFAADWLLRHGVQRGIEIISEASRRIPPELQATQPHVPRAQIIGIGNVLRHEYYRVSHTVVWNVVQSHSAPVKAAVRAILASLDES